MRVGLMGFGQTGKIVAQEILNTQDLELVWVMRKMKTDTDTYASEVLGLGPGRGRIYGFSEPLFRRLMEHDPVDVIIDFADKNAIYEYQSAADYGVRIVSAVSHYDEDQLKVLERMSLKTAVLHSPNITFGINFIIEISKLLQQLAPHADIEIVEEHFRGKKEISGTALRIADQLRVCPDNAINSIRVGGIVGKHEVIFGFPNQTIRITHETVNRAAFGQGAIYAAKWLIKKTVGFYTMEDVILLRKEHHHIS